MNNLIKIAEKFRQSSGVKLTNQSNIFEFQSSNENEIGGEFAHKIDLALSQYGIHQHRIDELIALDRLQELEAALSSECSTIGYTLPQPNSYIRCSRPMSPLREAIIDWISSQPYKLMLTIAPRLCLSDQENIDNLWFLLKRMNEHFFRRSWTKHRRKGITGIVVGEPHTHSNGRRGYLHFHLLLTQPPEMADEIRVFTVAIKNISSVTDLKGNRVFEKSQIDVRSIYDLKPLATYVTKSMEHFLFCKWGLHHAA